MPDYIELPLMDDADALTELGIDYLQTAIPGFTARPGNIETVLLEANSQMGAEVVAQAALVAPVIFAYLGQNLLGITLHTAQPARAGAVVTFDADAVVTLEAGAMLAVPNPDGNLYAFTLDTDAVSPVGGGDVSAGITALESSAAANGSYGQAELIEVIDGVTGIVVPAPASGGADEETEDEYLDRLTNAMSILAPRPILPEDHAAMARLVPGVGRALAIDLLLPGTAEAPGAIRDPNEPQPPPTASLHAEPRCTTVAVTAEDGSAPGTTLMQEVWSVLDANREVNFLNFVIAPTYTAIDVKATVVAYTGFLPADVQASAEESLRTWLNPSNWGANPSVASTGTEQWASDPYARIYEAVDYLNRADGVYRVQSVQLRKHGTTTWLDTDIPLTGLAPLPTSGDFTITVS